MTNKEFCYWLQGYFEITKKHSFTEERVRVIHYRLNNIIEPFGEFTQWLSEVLLFFSEQQYDQHFLDYLLPKVANRLNDLFDHLV